MVAGLIFVLLFGLQGYFGPWLREHDLKVIFAMPGLILATTFVTFPFVARELIPVMEAIGAGGGDWPRSAWARSGWQIFWRVTLPNIKWGLLYGVILCNARAMGEFGAVYVVSGHIAGQTDTHAAARREAVPGIQHAGRLRRRVGADAAGPGHAGRSRRMLERKTAARELAANERSARDRRTKHEHHRQERQQALRHVRWRSTT